MPISPADRKPRRQEVLRECLDGLVENRIFLDKVNASNPVKKICQSIKFPKNHS